jgi:tRNA (adenine22-N1)-methyltransferase
VKFKIPKPTARMELLVSLAEDGLPFWDVCCDHGHIGIHALNSKRFPKIYFVDSVLHIIQQLEMKMEDSLIDFSKDHVEIIHSKAQDLTYQVNGSMVIAGVGGRTILNILDDLYKKKLLQAHVLILSAHTDELLLTDFLKTSSLSQTYRFSGEHRIMEGKRIRKILVYRMMGTA